MKRVNPVFLVLILAGSVVSWLGCQHSNRGTEPAAETGFHQQPDPKVALRSPDDPSNKYFGQYEDHDRYLFEALASGTPAAVYSPAEGARFREYRKTHPDAALWLYSTDPDGDMLPFSRALTLLCEGRQRGDCSAYDKLPWRCVILEPGERLKLERQASRTSVNAAYAPRFPEWLIAEEFTSAMQLPNGWWVLGVPAKDGAGAAGDDSTGSCACGAPRDVRRDFRVFDSQGVLIGGPSHHWWLAAHQGGIPEGTLDDTLQWRIVFRAPDGDALSAWLYDGSPLDEAVTPKPNYPATSFLWYSADQVRDYANHQ